jgi:hypothetical protein
MLHSAFLSVLPEREPTLSYSEQFAVDVEDPSLNKPSRFDDCMGLQMKHIDDGQWDIEMNDVPMKLVEASDGSATFALDLGKCKKCKLPGQIRSASGKLSISGGAVKLQWDGELSDMVSVSLKKDD